MSRIGTRFAELRKNGRRALIPFVTAGDPEPAVTLELMHAMVAAGADLIELGMPFSDPMADGPVIQRAAERALAGGMTLGGVLDIVSEMRSGDAETPVVLMGYLNPIEAMGYETFASRAAEAGVDGVLLVDMPIEEGGPLLEALDRQGLDAILLLTPTTSEERLKLLCDRASGYVYYVSLKGVTGSAALDVDAVRERLTRIRALTDLPVGVGFGISDAESAGRIASVADGVIVGTAVVSRVEEKLERPGEVAPHVAALLREMRVAMDA